MKSSKLKTKATAKPAMLQFSVPSTRIDEVRKIQISEGYSPCFAANTETCDQHDCSWRKECFPGNFHQQ